VDEEWRLEKIIGRRVAVDGDVDEDGKPYPPGVILGQDEKIWKAFQMQKATWLVQSIRALRKKTDGPGLQFLQYGKNKEGYWDAEMFGKQIDRILDCFECLHPDWQLCLEVRPP